MFLLVLVIEIFRIIKFKFLMKGLNNWVKD